MSDEPTLGEVMRQVRGLINQVGELVKEVRSDYVRKDLYEARHTHIHRRADEIEKDLAEVKRDLSEREKGRVAFQRQVMAGLIVGSVLLLAQTIVTVVRLTGGAQ